MKYDTGTRTFQKKKNRKNTASDEKRRPMRKHINLKDRTIVDIEPPTGREDAKEFQRFINALTRKTTYLLVDKPTTLKEEKQ